MLQSNIIQENDLGLKFILLQNILPKKIVIGKKCSF